MSLYKNILLKPLILYYFLNNISSDIYNNIFSYINRFDQIYSINILKYRARELLINISPRMYICNINIINLSKDDIYYIIINYCGYPFIFQGKSFLGNNIIQINNNINLKQYYHKFSTNSLYNIKKKIKNYIPKFANLNKIRKKEKSYKDIYLDDDIYNDFII